MIHIIYPLSYIARDLCADSGIYLISWCWSGRVRTQRTTREPFNTAAIPRFYRIRVLLCTLAPWGNLRPRTLLVHVPDDLMVLVHIHVCMHIVAYWSGSWRFFIVCAYCICYHLHPLLPQTCERGLVDKHAYRSFNPVRSCSVHWADTSVNWNPYSWLLRLRDRLEVPLSVR